MAELSPRERVKERIPTLTAHTEEIKSVEPGIYNEFGPWSALKLIVHVATVNMYTTVISDHYKDWFYIDALAGSGLSMYGDDEDCFLGSPLLAATNAEEPFTKMYFIEEDKTKAAALDERLDVLCNKNTPRITPPKCGYEVLVGDANERLEDVVSDMWKVAKRNGDPRFNHLSFIDNQGLDLNWAGIRTLAPEPTGDLLVNFPSSNANRAANHVPSEDTVRGFYGGDMWKQADDQRQLLETYLQRLSGVEKTEQVVSTIDSGEKNYHYDMIYATRETQGGSEYIEAIEYVKEFVEAVDGADVEEMLQVLRGDQSTMEEFLPETENNDPQSGLHEFND